MEKEHIGPNVVYQPDGDSTHELELGMTYFYYPMPQDGVN